MGLWTQNETVRGGVCCHASHYRRGKSSGDQLWREQQLGEGGGHREQELRTAERSSDSAAPESTMLLYSSAAAVPPEPAFHTRGRSCRRGSNLKKIGPNDRVKVRVGEYDASGFNPPETRSHIEYTVSKIVRHPQFDAKRLSDDIAVMITSRVIDLQHPYVSPACFPSCQQQFDYVFSN